MLNGLHSIIIPIFILMCFVGRGRGLEIILGDTSTTWISLSVSTTLSTSIPLMVSLALALASEDKDDKELESVRTGYNKISAYSPVN